MSALLVWMDSHEAKLFYVEADGIHVEKVAYHGPRHHPETLGRNHTKDQTDETVFFRQLAEKLKTVKSSKWLLMGPGMAAPHFSFYLETQHKELFKKVIGMEKVDKMPDSEILSVGRNYLQKYYLYNAV